MRSAFVRLLAVSILSVFAAAPALAAGLRFEWSSTTGSGATGGESIEVSGTASETLTLDVILDAGPEGIAGVFYSISFDADLGDELNLVSATALDGDGTLTVSFSPNPLGTQESILLVQRGEVQTLNAATLPTIGPGPVNQSVLVAQLVFETNPFNVASDGIDIEFFENVGLDAILDAAGNNITSTTSFGTASVDAVIPEPSAALLFAAGAAVVTQGCRRRT